MGELWVRRFGSVAAFTLLLAAAIPPAQAVVPAVVLEGSGWGHGVGMAQDGAYWMGRAGIDTAGILGQFYPGTRTARAGGPVRVAVAATRPGDALLAFPGGGEIRDARTGPLAAGFPLRIPPGGQVLVRYDGGRYSAQPLAGAGSPGPPSEPGTAPSTPRTLWAIPRPGTTVALPATGHRYRGMIEAVGLPGGPGLRLLNEVDVEAYLRGMGEVRDPSWPPASLRAQAIAARTYALRAMATSGEICADERCQVYLGQQAEYPAMDEAVVRTSGLVLTFAGQLASTVYSANGGGESASREEGFGPAAAGPPADYPYLRAAPYPTRDPDPWSVVVALERVAARLGYPGELSSVSVVEAGPSGRALRVALDGSAGTRTVTGIEVARALGLRSTRFRAHGTVGAGAPASPAAAPLQVPPEEAAAVPPVLAEVAGRAEGTTNREGAPAWLELVIAVSLAVCLILRYYAGRAGEVTPFQVEIERASPA